MTHSINHAITVMTSLLAVVLPAGHLQSTVIITDMIVAWIVGCSINSRVIVQDGALATIALMMTYTVVVVILCTTINLTITMITSLLLLIDIIAV